MCASFGRTLLVTAIVLVSISAVAADCVTGLSAGESEARDAALQFLALLDQGKFGEAWDASSQRAKTEVTRDQFMKVMEGRAAMGTASDRALKSAHSTATFPGVPDSQYVALRFEVHFSKADRYPYLMEGVLVELEQDKHWRVVHMFGS